jgi:tRNA U34 5-methylaminomethyl-2-thiouridine-forming methyltransferase MnmC
LVKNGVYDDEYFHIEIFLGDAREYIKIFKDKFDIVYQDAFSPSKNPILWTQEYFLDIKSSMKYDGILTTYSTALATRLALYYNDFNIYINSGNNFRDATVASLSNIKEFKKVDMLHKLSCNPNSKPLKDDSLKI